MSGGIVLLNEAGRVVYASNDAVAILSYPARPAASNDLTEMVQRKLLALFTPGEQPHSGGFSATFRSGERTLMCRTFRLEPVQGRDALVALLLEPLGSSSGDLQQVLQKFSLTNREAEILHYLVLGLTNKEIGERMQISPNTVKSFLKLVMVKMGVSTRAAIVGRLLGSEHRLVAPSLPAQPQAPVQPPAPKKAGKLPVCA